VTMVDPALRTTRTTCPYCGVGCGVLATPDVNGGAAISGDPEHPANFGRLCSKGSALGETLRTEERLLYPMIRCSKGNMERCGLERRARPCGASLPAHYRAWTARMPWRFYLSGSC